MYVFYRYSTQCRLILVCNSPSRIIEPIRSRTLAIRIPSPTYEEISKVLTSVAKREGFDLPLEVAQRLSLDCDRNLRKALLMLETVKVQSGVMIPPDVVAPLPDWQLYIAKLARDILQEQTPSKLISARDMLYELLSNCIPGEMIMLTLVRELMKALDDQVKHEVAHWAAFYEHRMRQGSREIFHLEAFVAKFMSVYSKWLAEMFA